jgi:hypothetical protein
MGRPPIRKKGAMTAAERQRRHRRKLRAERRAAEIETKRAANSARAAEPRPPWTQALSIVVPGLPAPADELARQIEEYLKEVPEISIDDVLAAINKRFGR